MFFRKKDNLEQSDNVAKKSIKHMDAVVTWIILWSIVWSIYGVKKLKDKEHSEENIHKEMSVSKQKSFLKKLFFWK